eukprot:CAMPEP_0173248252 /NCGR_PEP_ID=MMETSP1142-20121109/18359_1 /TAXON_ID=483371 /ORGANISM="non described non described, Strain CCMP2298" /LENGTH=45 /DNA_ID= /DNA_START= /DNA_END= /DNA_ORIENTATION=
MPLFQLPASSPVCSAAAPTAPAAENAPVAPAPAGAAVSASVQASA